MPFIRTKTGCDPRPARKPTLLDRILLKFDASPDYDLDPVAEWLIEIDEDGLPFREIGLGVDGEPVLAGPDSRNYGFWLDTNMTHADFEDAEPIEESEFESIWDAWYAEPGRPDPLE